MKKEIFKSKQIIILWMLFFTTDPLIMAQGTIDDYHRAYTLKEKFSFKNVYHWAYEIHWLASNDELMHGKLSGNNNKEENIFYYNIYTPEGIRYIKGSVDSDETICYNTKEELNIALGIPEKKEKHNPFRLQNEPHWMQVDEENAQIIVSSPSGKNEAWIQGNNVVIHSVGDPYDKVTALSSDGTIGDYYSDRIMWSPDEKYIFVCKRQATEKRFVNYVESSPYDQLQPILHTQEYAKPGDRLPQKTPTIFEIQTNKQLVADKTLCKEQYELLNFEWTCDSREVIFDYNERGHKVYRVLAMDAETGKVRTIIEETANTFINYTRYFRHLLKDGSEMIWMSERDNWNHLYLYDVAKANVKTQITKGEWCVREVLYVDEDTKTIFFSASGVNKDEDPYFVHYYKIDFDGKNMICLTPNKANHNAKFSPNHKYLIDTYSTINTPPITELRDAEGKLIRTLEKADITKIEEQGWKAPEIFVAKGRDNETDMWGLIYRPTNFDSTKTYPVIEYIYSGPGSSYVTKNFNPYDYNMTSLCELGFIVVQLDAMGTSWRGKKFEEECYKNLKDAGFPDRIAWIKAAAEQYSYIDTTRVGIFGASAGGQESVAALLFHGDFYKAAYSACGCHDNRMDKIWWNEQWMGYPIDSSYLECSNVYNAEKLKGELLLVVGELDDNVDPSSTYQLVDALIKANKDFELVVLPGVKHTMGGEYGEHKRYDFFVRNLLNVTPPKWNEL